MMNHNATSLATTLFARKGEAMPSPAVGYVSIAQLEARTDERPLRAPLRLVGASGIQSSADDPGVPLSTLIHRHRPCLVPVVPAAPANDSTATAWERRENRGTRIDIMRYLSVPSAHTIGDAVGGDAVGGEAVGGEAVETRPFLRPAPRPRRKQLTLRLDFGAFRKLRNISYTEDVTYQSLLEAGVLAYLETLDTESAVGTG